MAHSTRSERPRTAATHRITATLAAALLLALAVERGTAIVAGVALVPFLLALHGTRTGEGLGLGVGFGTAYALLLAHWIPPALAALGSSSGSAWVGFAIAAAWAGPPVFVVVAAVERALRTRPAWTRALALGGAVFAAEWTLSRAWWGVPWGLVGHSQRDALGVAQLATVGGVPAISMLLVAVNAAIADALRGRRGARWLAAACLSAWLALALVGLSVAKAARPDRAMSSRVWLLVQPDLPRGERWAPELQALNLHRVRESVDRARASQSGPVDAIALPENLLTTPVDAHPELRRALEGWVDTLGVPVLAGLVLSASPPAPGRHRSAAVWIEPGRGITARVDKERAIPVIESARSFPGASWLAARFGAATRWDKVEEAPAATPFDGPIPVAPLLCYEALFPAIAAQRRGRETEAIVNLADAGWLPSAAARRRLGDLARFRAIEQRAPTLRVALGGPSWHVDAFGRVLALHRDGRAGALRVRVPSSPPPRVGERAAIFAVPLLAFATIAALSALARAASGGPDGRGDAPRGALPSPAARRGSRDALSLPPRSPRIQESSMRRFEDRAVLITGAASGIGHATALRIAEEGGRVFCLDVQTEAVEATAKQARELGVEAEAMVCDVSDETAVDRAVAACVERFGKLDALAHVAGILRFSHTHEMDTETWRRIQSINTDGTFFVCRAALPHLVASKGNIVNVSSVAAKAGLAYGAGYAASKGAVLSFSKALAVEYGQQGVRVNSVCPGSIKTPMSAGGAGLPKDADMKLVLRQMALDKPRGPETVASLIAFLASDDAAHINGEDILVDGGTLA